MVWSLFSLINIGKGNPQEAFGKEILTATQQLVVQGPYRYTRNPMGYGWFNIAAGIGVKIGSISTLLIVLPIMLITVIWYLKYFEEKNLVKRFGRDYLEYRQKVRLLIPKVFVK
jgi:protein-S-isoprenylcysteine O-methyltransferase Ste14